jgi:hypothetical protein
MAIVHGLPSPFARWLSFLRALSQRRLMVIALRRACPACPMAITSPARNRTSMMTIILP